MSVECPSHFIDVIIGTNASEVLYISPEIRCGVGPVWNCRGLIIRNWTRNTYFKVKIGRNLLQNALNVKTTSHYLSMLKPIWTRIFILLPPSGMYLAPIREMEEWERQRKSLRLAGCSPHKEVIQLKETWVLSWDSKNVRGLYFHLKYYGLLLHTALG